jgi:hypothetical protein
MSKVWIFQKDAQVKNLGAKAPWLVGWYDPQGKRKSKTVGSKSMATKFARKLEGQLAAGTYQDNSRIRWSDFRAEYERKKLSAMHGPSRVSVLAALDAFERVVKPVKVSVINTNDDTR